MLLNCDLGESYGAWSMDPGEEIMQYIDQANIACGYHAGDPIAMKKALDLAVKHQVDIGAHPSYPDLQGFGRRSMQMSQEELIGCLHYQISALSGMAAINGGELAYVKPHGALYNDMMKSADIRKTVMLAISQLNKSVPLMLQATTDYLQIEQEALAFGLPLMFEAFADRAYTKEGLLVNRQISGAVLSESEALLQAKSLIETSCVKSIDGNEISLRVDTLCVHGDTPDALSMVREIKQLILNNSKLDNAE